MRKKLIYSLKMSTWFLVLMMMLGGLAVASNGDVEPALATNVRYWIEDGELVFEFELVNQGSSSQKIYHGSGQQFEVVIYDQNGGEVYRYSDGKAFTMALIYRDLASEESLKWNDRWDLTNKNGDPIKSGDYLIEVTVLAWPVESNTIFDPATLVNEIQLTVVERLLNHDGDRQLLLREGNVITIYQQDNQGFSEIFKLDLNRQTIEPVASRVINALRLKDGETLAQYVHPVKGVRFTPYTYVNFDQDQVFDSTAIKNFFDDEQLYLWGYYDGTGNDILLAPSDYYENFIYSHDFVNAEEIGYNKVLSSGNMIENQFEVYNDPIVVEYYFSGFNPNYAGMDWRSLRLVFEEYDEGWYLVGVIYNQWTV